MLICSCGGKLRFTITLFYGWNLDCKYDKLAWLMGAGMFYCRGPFTPSFPDSAMTKSKSVLITWEDDPHITLYAWVPCCTPSSWLLRLSFVHERWCSCRECSARMQDLLFKFLISRGERGHGRSSAKMNVWKMHSNYKRPNLVHVPSSVQLYSTIVTVQTKKKSPQKIGIHKASLEAKSTARLFILFICDFPLTPTHFLSIYLLTSLCSLQ